MKARRRRGLLLLSLALVSGGLAASEVRERERRAEERLGPSIPVLIARDDLRTEDAVTRAALAVREMPARFLPPGALGPAARVVGARPAVPVPAGTPLTAAFFADAAREWPGPGGPLGPGERAVTVEVAADPAAAASPPGTRVDVLVSSESGRTNLALAGVELLALEPGTGVDGPIARATLRVTLRQAIELTAADNFAREIRLLPRPRR